MKRLARHLLDAATVLSLLCCATTLVLWVWPRSVWFSTHDWYVSLAGPVRVLWYHNPWSFYTLEWRAEYLSLFVITAALPAMRVRPVILRRLAQARAERAAGVLRCAKCGYDIRATPGRCPECGTMRRGRSRQPWEH